MASLYMLMLSLLNPSNSVKSKIERKRKQHTDLVGYMPTSISRD
jgi:hypothetical protein